MEDNMDSINTSVCDTQGKSVPNSHLKMTLLPLPLSSLPTEMYILRILLILIGVHTEN